MKMEGVNNLLLSDTLVADIFISEYMVSLSSAALKSYLYILLAFKSQKSLSEKDLAARISLSLDEIKAALSELSMAGIVEWNDKGTLRLIDLKELEVRSYIHSHQGESSLPKLLDEENEQRDSLARSLEKTFFHGSMAYKWYRQIDILLDEFGFEPQVVYKLFQICNDRRRLGTVTQMQSMAVLWKGKGISTMEQLSSYLAHEDVIFQTSRKIGKRLHRKMTDYDEEYIRVWIEKLGYSYEIIDFGIRKMCEYQQPTMNKADAHLKSWFAAGLKTLAEVKTYEDERAKANKLAYQQSKQRAPEGSQKRQNFSGVEYSAEVLESLYADPDAFVESLNQAKSE